MRLILLGHDIPRLALLSRRIAELVLSEACIGETALLRISFPDAPGGHEELHIHAIPPRDILIDILATKAELPVVEQVPLPDLSVLIKSMDTGEELFIERDVRDFVGDGRSRWHKEKLNSARMRAMHKQRQLRIPR